MFYTIKKKERWQESINPHSILINGVPCHVKDPCIWPRLASWEDDGNDKSSVKNSNTPLFFSAGQDNSSAEPEKNDSEDDDEQKQKGPSEHN